MPRGHYDRTKMKRRTDDTGGGASTGTGSRVFWKPHEITTLVDAAVATWREKPEDGVTLGLIKDTQRKALPPDRQRSLVTVTACKDVYATIKHRVRAIVANATAAEAQVEVPPAPAPAPAVPIITEPAPVQKPVSVEEVLDRISFAKLSAVYHQRKVEHEQTAHREMMEALTGRTSKIAEREPMDLGIADIGEAQKLYPKVVVLGLRGDQVRQVQERLKLHPIQFINFIDPGTAPHRSHLHLDDLDVLLVDTKQTPEHWRMIVARLQNEHVISDKVQVWKPYGVQSVIDSCLKIIAGWRSANQHAAAIHDKFQKQGGAHSA